MAVSGVFAGVLEESSRKISGKLLEKFSRIAKMLQILGFRAPGKANLPGTLGPHCRDLVPTFPAGCFLKSTVPAFSSFSYVHLHGHPREHSREHSSGSLCMGL